MLRPDYGGELQKRATLKHNLRVAADNLSEWKRFHDLMKDFDPDICKSDLEPTVPILRFCKQRDVADNSSLRVSFSHTPPAKPEA